MASTSNFRRIALSLILACILFNIALGRAITENNYTNSNNILSDVSETTHTENGYKLHIIANPDAVGIYAQEGGYKLNLAINQIGIGGSFKENNYRLDLIPEKSFPPGLGTRVTGIAVSKTIVGQGFTVDITVIVSNLAYEYEASYVTINANATTLHGQTVILTGGNFTTITYVLNSASLAKGNYTISAHAISDSAEAELADSILTNGWILVAMPGDIAPDYGIVDIFDLVRIALRFGETLPQPVPWPYPLEDINSDGIVDIFDIVVVALHFGETG